MDFLPDHEFNQVFDRISKKIDLQGCANAQEVHSRLKTRIHEYRMIYSTPLRALQNDSKISVLRNLIAAGFGRRTIDEAIANPRGTVALTLKYGREKALRIIEKRKQKHIW